MPSAESGEEGEEAVKEAFSSMGDTVETGVELCEGLCRSPERFHPFQRVFHCEGVVMESTGSGFVEEGDTRIAQANAPLNILPTVERNVFTKRDVLRNCARETDVTCVREAVLGVSGEELPCVLRNVRIAELPSCFFKPVHDGGDDHYGIPCGEAESSFQLPAFSFQLFPSQIIRYLHLTPDT